MYCKSYICTARELAWILGQSSATVRNASVPQPEKGSSLTDGSSTEGRCSLSASDRLWAVSSPLSDRLIDGASRLRFRRSSQPVNSSVVLASSELNHTSWPFCEAHMYRIGNTASGGADLRCLEAHRGEPSML